MNSACFGENERMKKSLVAGNWKMNGTQKRVEALLSGIKQHYEPCESVECVLFPSFIYLQQAASLLQHSSIAWGGQSVSRFDAGAYTGDVSAAMLVDQGCEYVLIGHSERRSLFGETNAMVVEQLNQALRVDLKPIICVGETLEQREAGLAVKTINDQLQPVLESLANPSILSHLVVAYEPVWAIGTGRHATPEQAQAVHHEIRQLLVDFDAGLGNAIRIIYGGSVKSSNAAGLFEMPDIDGALVGGASLDAEEFLKIGALCNQSCS